MVSFCVSWKSFFFHLPHTLSLSVCLSHTQRTSGALSTECDRHLFLLLIAILFYTLCPFFSQHKHVTWPGIVTNLFYFGCYLSTFLFRVGLWYVRMQMKEHSKSKLLNGKRYWEIAVLITALNHRTSDALMAVFMSDLSTASVENRTHWARAQGEQSLPFNQCPSLLRTVIMGMSGASKIGCANRSLMGDGAECEICKA